MPQFQLGHECEIESSLGYTVRPNLKFIYGKLRPGERSTHSPLPSMPSPCRQPCSEGTILPSSGRHHTSQMFSQQRFGFCWDKDSCGSVDLTRLSSQESQDKPSSPWDAGIPGEGKSKRFLGKLLVTCWTHISQDKQGVGPLGEGTLVHETLLGLSRFIGKEAGTLENQLGEKTYEKHQGLSSNLTILSGSGSFLPTRPL